MDFVVFAGARELKGDTLGYELYPLIGDDGELMGHRLYSEKSLKSKVIGGVYTGALFTERSAQLRGSVIYTRKIDDPRVIDWEAEDFQAKTRDKGRRLEAKVKRGEMTIDEIMRPIRERLVLARRRFDFELAAAIELRVLDSLRRR